VWQWQEHHQGLTVARLQLRPRSLPGCSWGRESLECSTEPGPEDMEGVETEEPAGLLRRVRSPGPRALPGASAVEHRRGPGPGARSRRRRGHRCGRAGASTASG